MKNIAIYVVLLNLLILISPFCISQPLYPKKAIINGDTVCLISIEQVKTLNKVFVDRDECKELNDSLGSQIKNYDKLVSEDKGIIASQDKEIILYKKIDQEKTNIIEIDNKMIQKDKHKIKWLKVQRNGLAVLSCILMMMAIIA